MSRSDRPTYKREPRAIRRCRGCGVWTVDIRCDECVPAEERKAS